MAHIQIFSLENSSNRAQNAHRRQAQGEFKVGQRYFQLFWFFFFVKNIRLCMGNRKYKSLYGKKWPILIISLGCLWCHEMCLAVFTNLESLSRSLFQCENRLYLFSTKVFSKAEIAKELWWLSPSVGKILEHFRIYGTAIPLYSHGDSQPSVQCLIYQRKPGRAAGHGSQENFEYSTNYFQNTGRRHVKVIVQ